MVSPASKSLSVLPFLRNRFEVALGHFLTMGIKGAFCLELLFLFPNFEVPGMLEQLTQLFWTSLFSTWNLISVPSLAKNQEGFWTRAIAQRKSLFL